MQLLNSRFFKPIGLVILTGVLVALASLYQNKVLNVEATVQVIVVSHTAIPFGTVFPGEDMGETYSVTLDTSARSANYVTTLEAVSGLKDLCPWLEIKSIDNPFEPDSLANGELKKVVDIRDKWQVRLKVPAIKGNVAQDHDGGIIVKDGEYGCKIRITLKDPPKPPKINLVKKGEADKNGNVFYTIKYELTGNGLVPNVIIRDRLPEGSTFVSASNGGTYSNGHVTWNLGNLNAPTSGSVQLQVKLTKFPKNCLVQNKAWFLSTPQIEAEAINQVDIPGCTKR